MSLLILDRDGVINEDSDDYVKSADEWRAIPGSIEAIARLSRAGFDIFIATNQSGLGRGLFSQNDLEEMHAKMTTMVQAAGGELRGIYYCPHRPDQHCDCRKPSPGLLEQISQDTGRSLRGIPMIGDSLRDLLAGQAVGCQPILVKTGKGASTLRELQAGNDTLLKQLPVFDSLARAADALLSETTLIPGENAPC